MDMEIAVKFVIGALAVVAGAAGTETLRLKDGSLLQGEVVEKSDSVWVVRSASLGEIRVPVAAMQAGGLGWERKAPVAAEEAGREVVDPSDQALFFLPTAFTPARGSFMFRDFELLFLTFGYSPTASTTLTGGFLFPISSEVQLLTAGLKQRIWDSEDGRHAVAVAYNFTKPVGGFADDLNMVMTGNMVLGTRAPNPLMGAKDAFGFHGALGILAARAEESDYVNGVYGMRTEWRTNLSFGAGMEARMTSNSKFMLEYLSVAPFDTGEDFEGGLLTLGFRLHGARLAADIAGVRPLTGEDLGSFFLWPLLVVSYRI